MLRMFIVQGVTLFALAVAAATGRAQDVRAGLASDSIGIELLRLAVREAEIDAERTGFWRRAVPRIELTAGFSAGDIIFAEAASGGPYLLPKDSYRLSVGLSLGGLLDGAAHEKALVLLGRAKTALHLAEARLEESRRARQARASVEDSLRPIHAEDLRIKEEIVRYQELLFAQGEGGFDALARARLVVLAARAAALAAPLPSGAGKEER